uniref:F-box domain-containing protein n=1 Tax=Bionectria ochroleuca TaxID=29856 RepID=A0A8H7NBS4_BIOOC
MGRSSAMKSRAKSKAPHQPLPDALHDRLSSLPMEILEMIVENITDSSAMGKLSRTSKIYYSLAAPRLHRRMVVLEAYHSRLLKMARALDSHLTIAQKRQLEKRWTNTEATRRDIQTSSISIRCLNAHPSSASSLLVLSV